MLDEAGRTAVSELPAARGADDHDRTSVRAVSVPTGPATPHVPAGAVEDDDEDVPATVSGGVVLGLLAVLVAVTVGVVVWAVDRGDEPAPTAAPSTLTRTAPPSRAVDAPEQPAIDARAAAGAVTFTWNYVGAEDDDFFQLRVAPTEAEVVDAEVVTVKDAARYTVRAGGGPHGLRAGDGLAGLGRRLPALADPLRECRMTRRADPLRRGPSVGTPEVPVRDRAHPVPERVRRPVAAGGGMTPWA